MVWSRSLLGRFLAARPQLLYSEGCHSNVGTGLVRMSEEHQCLVHRCDVTLVSRSLAGGGEERQGLRPLASFLLSLEKEMVRTKEMGRLGLAPDAWLCPVSTDFSALLCWASWHQPLVAHNIVPTLQSRKLRPKESKGFA